MGLGTRSGLFICGLVIMILSFVFVTAGLQGSDIEPLTLMFSIVEGFLALACVVIVTVIFLAGAYFMLCGIRGKVL